MVMNTTKSQATFMVPKTQDWCKLNLNLPGYPAKPASWYRPQESQLVHLLWSGPNRMLNKKTKCFGVVRFYTALFASEPEIVNKITCAKDIYSLVHPFNCIWNRTETTSSAESRYV